MPELDPRYGERVRIDPNSEAPEEVLRRIPLGTPAAEGGIDESSLQNLLFGLALYSFSAPVFPHRLKTPRKTPSARGAAPGARAPGRCP